MKTLRTTTPKSAHHTPLTPSEQIDCVESWCRLFIEPEQVVELRALKVRNQNGKPHTEAGFYHGTELRKLAEAALSITNRAAGVYYTLNPLQPELLARRNCRMDWATEGELAKDKDIIQRRWLLIDVDPQRDSLISSTEFEKTHAFTTVTAMRDELQTRGWPQPILLDSGNGYHLYYRIDLPTHDDGLVKRVLDTLATQYDTEHARVDRAVSNPARLGKVPGTIARKGDHTPERPHRRARVLTNPEQCEVVSVTQLQSFAVRAPALSVAVAAAPSNPAPRTAPTRFSSRLLVDRWLSDRGIAFRKKSVPDAHGRDVYVLECCPFDASHRDPDACIMQASSGQLSACCFHNSCAANGWKEFKTRIGAPEPQHYDPPLTDRNRNRRKSRTDPPTPHPETENAENARRVVRIAPASRTVADTMADLTDVFLDAQTFFRRAEQFVRVEEAAITPILSPAGLSGQLNALAEVCVEDHNKAESTPLPITYANTWLNHPEQTRRLPVISLFTLNPVFTTDWRLSPPGYDRDSGIYYAGSPIPPRESTTHLETLLRDFCFRTPGDRTNYLGMLLTTVLMPRFIGCKPALLLSGNQPSLGKTVLAQIVSIVRDGRPTESATYVTNDEEFEKRLGAIVHRGATTILIDNAKGKGRAARIDSACLERSITDTVLSFRLLGQSREIRAENSHIFCLTANSPEVSRDLLTRCVVVNLYHEGDPTRREFSLSDPESYALEHREVLLGELLGLVSRWRAGGGGESGVRSRFNKKGWGSIVGGVLAAGGFTDFLSNAESVAEELDDSRGDFGYLVSKLVDHPQGTWTASELGDFAVSEGLYPTEFKNISARGVATRMGVLASRFVGSRFAVSGQRWAQFHRTEDRKGKVYYVSVVSESEPTASEA